MPAFGVTMGDFERLRAIGCVLVDTTCGSVLNVWKRVESYARDGFTAIIHGKHYHEETKATASQVMKYPGGRYLVVLNMAEARIVCDFIEQGGDVAALAARFATAVSPGFDFERDLQRVGIANQTTMLSGESLAIAEEVRRSMERRYGAETVAEHFRSFDTICSATQERQDAVLALLQEPLDLMVVVGGYNSSNTCHLAALVHSKGVRTFHIEDAEASTRRRGRSATSRSAPSTRSRPPAGSGTAASSGSPPAPRRRTTRSARRSLASARWPAWRRSCAPRPGDPRRMTFVDLSHTIEHGMTTYPGLPGPLICDFLSREASRGRYAPGVEFQIGRIDMVANTGTYLDSPFHRYADGKDLVRAAARARWRDSRRS